MIIGVGTDIVEIDRIAKAMDRQERFLTKLFTENEISYFESRGLRPETVAGNFCAKEAVVKAMGTGLRGFNWTDIEVLRDDLGKPVLHLYQGAKAKTDQIGIDTIHISISHCKTYATATAVAEREKV